MTEEISVPESSEPQSVHSLGQQLRTAREALGLNIEDVSRQLCLSPRQVTALESDAFDALPSPTFVRGFIRNYAKLLQLDADTLLSLYRGKAPELGSSASISLHSEGIPIQTGNRSAWLPYLIASILVVLAGVGWWFYMDWRESHPAETVKSEKTEALPTQQSANEPPPMGAGMQTDQLVQPVTPEATPAPTAPVTPAAAPTASTATPPVQAPAATPAPAAVQAPPQAASQARLEMKFSETSWVRVLDGSGTELLNKNKSAGSEETITGKPPFKLEIGNVSGAVVIYNGQSVDLVPHAKANVARLTLE